MTHSNQVTKVANGAAAGCADPHPPEAPGPEPSIACELDLFGTVTIKPPRRGAGRPPGSANRSTLALQRFLQAQGYRDPAEFLASVVTMDTAELAKALSCGKLDALQQQLRAAGELMPYFHQRMPLAVDLTKAEAPRRLIVMSDLATPVDTTRQSLPNGANGAVHPRGE